MNNQTIPTRKRIRLLITCLCMSFLFSQCFLKQDRTTVVYGTITDEKGQPVDSILVLVQGVKGFRYDDLKRSYTDDDGKYELTIEVPKLYSTVDVLIPTLPLENQKFEDNYKEYTVSKNDNAPNNCCLASIGDKTKYDFQLVPK